MGYTCIITNITIPTKIIDCSHYLYTLQFVVLVSLSQFIKTTGGIAKFGVMTDQGSPLVRLDGFLGPVQVFVNKTKYSMPAHSKNIPSAHTEKLAPLCGPSPITQRRVVV